jgi:DUF4097 and DUF4098 domain-containing protein YvlB
VSGGGPAKGIPEVSTFATPEPISVTIDIAVGDVRIAAGDRADTVVEVRPSDANDESDLDVAVRTRVEYTEGALLVRAPKPRMFGLFGAVGSIDVTIALPAGSRVHADASMAAVRGTGRLGECRIRTSSGDVTVDRTGRLDLATGSGAVTVGRVDGTARISTGSGRVQVEEIGGAATVKNSNGDSWLGAVAGELLVSAANGSIAVDHAGTGVTAATANGDIVLGAVAGGAVSARTSYGEIEIGIPPGTAAWLDLHTQFGTVHNRLDVSDAPPAGDTTVEIKARTSYGDIVIRRG